MTLYRPASLDDALRILADNPDARCLAGGQSLVAMINLGLLEPTDLVALGDIPGFDGIERGADGGLILGAGVTQAALADAVLTGSERVLGSAARQVAHPAIRNFGTLGGSLCHADPAADPPPAVVAAEARLTVRNASGTREIAADDFFLDYLATALEPGEILTRISLPPPASGSTGLYYKFARVDGDYATVSVAVTLTVEDGTCTAIRIALGGCAPRPLRLPDAESLLVGTALTGDDLDRAGRLLRDAADPLDDVRGSADYRRRIIPGLVARAVQMAHRQLAEPA